MKSGNRGKDLYRELRALPWAKLWEEEVPRFNRGTPRERFDQVSVVRAVGVVFSEKGPVEKTEEVKRWLQSLLRDPEEKVRRYAMAALPKIGADARQEAELIALLKKPSSAREEKHAQEALGKIGGEASVRHLGSLDGLSLETVQRVKATAARNQAPSAIRMTAKVAGLPALRIHLRGRDGLETVVRDEVLEQGKFNVVEVSRGRVTISPMGPFTLADLYALRCFATVGFVLGWVDRTGESKSIQAFGSAITSPQAIQLFETLTEGSIRYRLECFGNGVGAGLVRQVADNAFRRCTRILNDAREAPWAVEIYSNPEGSWVELRPRVQPDPRYFYRLDDVPAASHPPLAACMVRLAGAFENETVWDPFCGSGLELIERALKGGVRQIYGTDLSPEAVDIAERNFGAARLGAVAARFYCADFREIATVAGLAPESLSLILSNPPLDRRVRIPDIQGLFNDLLALSAKMLRPGGRLIFTNPLRMENPHPLLTLQRRLVVDLGGFDCRLELYRKVAKAGTISAGPNRPSPARIPQGSATIRKKDLGR